MNSSHPILHIKRTPLAILALACIALLPLSVSAQLLPTAAAPSATKSFSPTTINSGATSTLTIGITNNSNGTLNGVNFTDTFPAGMSVASPPGATNTCGGTFAPAATDTSISLTGVTMSGNATCQVTVAITATATGMNSVTINSSNGGSSTAATDTLTVNTVPVRLQSFDVD